MRGALSLIVSALAVGGIIPADAGSTLGRLDNTVAGGDHPRGCGEHLLLVVPTWRGVGSSPRMRGARRVGQPMGHLQGIIPADAGSTIANVLKKNDIRDHPRGCGEHEVIVWSTMYESGSSPRMRGAQLHETGLVPSLRIIPADAGSTSGA